MGVGLRVSSSLGLAHDRWLRMAGLLLTLNSAICVKFTSKGGAKGNSDGQLVCYTLHGVVRQPGQRVQLLPGVGWCGNTFLWAAEQHDVTANIQWALDSTGRNWGGHWQMKTMGQVASTVLQTKYNIFPFADEYYCHVQWFTWSLQIGKASTFHT